MKPGVHGIHWAIEEAPTLGLKVPLLHAVGAPLPMPHLKNVQGGGEVTMHYVDKAH